MLNVLLALSIMAALTGLCALLVWLTRAVPHWRYERSIKGLVSQYADAIVRLTVLGPPSFYEITSFTHENGHAYKQWVCRIFLRPSLAFTLEKLWFKERWSYRVHFFDPRVNQYCEFSDDEVWGTRSEWFTAKAETLVQALDAYQLHPLVKTREGSAFNSEHERFPALFRVTEKNKLDFDVFFSGLGRARSAA